MLDSYFKITLLPFWYTSSPTVFWALLGPYDITKGFAVLVIIVADLCTKLFCCCCWNGRRQLLPLADPQTKISSSPSMSMSSKSSKQYIGK